MSEEVPRYRFGPLERRGLVAGWRGGQIAAVAAGLVVAVAILRASPSPAGVALAVVALGTGVAVAAWPVGGRTAEEWAPDALRHAAVVAGRRMRRRAPFAGLDVLEVAMGEGGVAGVAHDGRVRTYTAVLPVSAPGIVLLGDQEQARRVREWASFLAASARQGTDVHRLQWIERVETGGAGPAAAPPEDDAGSSTAGGPRDSYHALLRSEAGRVRRHRVHVAVTVSAVRSARAVKAAGGGGVGACTVLLREVAVMRRRLGDAGITTGAVLDPPSLRRVVRHAFDPPTCASAPGWPAAPASDLPATPAAGWPAAPVAGWPAAPVADLPAPPAAASSRDGERWPWPMGVAREWGHLRTDGAVHATFWVSEWPRVDVAADFLAPLLLSSPACRSVSVVMEPFAPVVAARKVEQARIADIADAELRRRGGFLATARRRREEEVLARREVELADGHAQYRFSGYVAVSAGDLPALEDACRRTEQAAGRAGVELRRCYGAQLEAFLCTLPFGRGLA